jgi:hypothetical protein
MKPFGFTALFLAILFLTGAGFAWFDVSTHGKSGIEIRYGLAHDGTHVSGSGIAWLAMERAKTQFER